MLSQKSLMSSCFTSSHKKEGDLSPNFPGNRRQPRLDSFGVRFFPRSNKDCPTTPGEPAVLASGTEWEMGWGKNVQPEEVFCFSIAPKGSISTKRYWGGGWEWQE